MWRIFLRNFALLHLTFSWQGDCTMNKRNCLESNATKINFADMKYFLIENLPNTTRNRKNHRKTWRIPSISIFAGLTNFSRQHEFSRFAVIKKIRLSHTFNTHFNIKVKLTRHINTNSEYSLVFKLEFLQSKSPYRICDINNSKEKKLINRIKRWAPLASGLLKSCFSLDRILIGLRSFNS